MAELRQLTLDDAVAAKEQGIKRAARKAGSVWVGYALARLEELCRTQHTVWAGDLRRACVLCPASPYAWATPWLMARRRGWIEPKPVDWRPADWATAQRHLSPVYRSRLFGQHERAAEQAA